MASNRHESGGANVPFLGNVPQSAVNRYFGQVLPIFGVMLLVTAAVTAGFVATGLWKVVFGFGIIALIGLLVVQMGLFFAAQALRDMYPLNVVFALLFAGFEGVFIAPIIAGYVNAGLAGLIGQALGITAVVFVAMSAIPLVTGRDFRFLGGFLFVGLLVLIVASLANAFLFGSGVLGIVLNVGSVLLFSVFILYDMSKIIENDWGPVAGAISLYLDFILIFLNVLELLGDAN